MERGTEKQGFYPDPLNTDLTSHQSTSSESVVGVCAMLVMTFKRVFVQNEIYRFRYTTTNTK